jgi:hypothetical protein
MPETSTLQTVFFPSQQFCEALMPPPSKTSAPQMLPVPLQACPLSQRPFGAPLQTTVPFGFMPPPQHSFEDVQLSPVSRQPPAS